jgi:hypothetical protein
MHIPPYVLDRGRDAPLTPAGRRVWLAVLTGIALVGIVLAMLSR